MGSFKEIIGVREGEAVGKTRIKFNQSPERGFNIITDGGIPPPLILHDLFEEGYYPGPCKQGESAYHAPMPIGTSKQYCNADGTETNIEQGVECIKEGANKGRGCWPGTKHWNREQGASIIVGENDNNDKTVTVSRVGKSDNAPLIKVDFKTGEQNGTCNVSTLPLNAESSAEIFFTGTIFFSTDNKSITCRCNPKSEENMLSGACEKFVEPEGSPPDRGQYAAVTFEKFEK